MEEEPGWLARLRTANPTMANLRSAAPEVKLSVLDRVQTAFKSLQ